MANNIYHDPNYNFPPARAQNHGGMAAYLLGMGPMPPPQPQDLAVAMANHMLDNPHAGADDDDEDENIDPQLRGPDNTQAQAQVLSAYISVHYFLLHSPSAYCFFQTGRLWFASPSMTK